MGTAHLKFKKMRTLKGTKYQEWLARTQSLGPAVCEDCQREVMRLTVDHIIPLSILERLDEGHDIAWNDEENFRLICGPCNSFKSGYIDITNPKTAHLLVKYMQPYL